LQQQRTLGKMRCHAVEHIKVLLFPGKKPEHNETPLVRFN
jgi:hypothetical protein